MRISYILEISLSNSKSFTDWFSYFVFQMIDLIYSIIISSIQDFKLRWYSAVSPLQLVHSYFPSYKFCALWTHWYSVAESCFLGFFLSVKDKLALCFRKITQQVSSSSFALWLPCLPTVVTMSCLFWPCQHSQTVQERLRERDGWRWDGVKIVLFRRWTTSKRRFFHPRRPLLSNRKPRCQN